MNQVDHKKSNFKEKRTDIGSFKAVHLCNIVFFSVDIESKAHVEHLLLMK
jgi:hypothetical protein